MSKTETRRAISEIVLNPSFRGQVARDPNSALSRYKLKEVEVEFLKYLARGGLPGNLDQRLPPYSHRSSHPGTRGPGGGGGPKP